MQQDSEDTGAGTSVTLSGEQLAKFRQWQEEKGLRVNNTGQDNTTATDTLNGLGKGKNKSNHRNAPYDTQDDKDESES